MTMEGKNYRISFAFPCRELVENVMKHLSMRELAARHPSATQGLARRFTGSEREEEYVESRLHTAAWRVCSALGGWNATTDFDVTDEIGISLNVGYAAPAEQLTLLAECVRDWICCIVAHETAEAVLDDSDATDLAEDASLAQQRVMMMLCAADTLRKAC